MTDSTSGANAADIMMKFESLGADCVFGYVQRSVGAEPLGLLRWACMPFPRLLEALDNKFKGLGVPENIEIEASDEVHATLGDREYTATDRSYDMWAHTFVPVSPDADLAAVALDVGRRSRFLSRGLLDELEIGEKIFIYKDAANALTDADRAALLAVFGGSENRNCCMSGRRNPVPRPAFYGRSRTACSSPRSRPLT